MSAHPRKTSEGRRVGNGHFRTTSCWRSGAWDIKNGPCFIKLVCVSTPSRSKNILRAVIEAMELQGVDGARMLVKGPASWSCRTHFFLSGVKQAETQKCWRNAVPPHTDLKNTQTLMTNPDDCDVNKPRCSEANRSGVSKEIERAIMYPMGIIAYLLPLRT